VGIGKTLQRAYSINNRNKYWRHISQKGYEVEILFQDLSWEQACEKEKEFIALYGRVSLGSGTLVNMTDGGEGTCGMKPWNYGKQPSQEQVEKMIKNHKGMKGRKHSEETKLKIRLSSIGKKGTRLGHKSSDETKLKIRNSQLGKKLSPETRMKISNTLKQKLNGISNICQ
jgi:hypothetical protein